MENCQLERERGGGDRSDKWCLCVHCVVILRRPAMEILICVEVQVEE